MQKLATIDHLPEPGAGATFAVHTLFVDVVGYSRLKADEQGRMQGELRALFDATPEVQKAQADGRLIRRPTGDGMAVLFRAGAGCTVADAARCALTVDLALRRKHARRARGEFSFRLRMGIHTGDVRGETDVNGTLDVAGDGIIYGQRVMDCGDGGHILLTGQAATLLRQVAPELGASLGDLGTVRVKNDQLLHVYSLYGTLPDGTPFGNEVLPKAVANSRKELARRDADSRASERRHAAGVQWGGVRRSVWLVLGAVALSFGTHNLLIGYAPWYSEYLQARERSARSAAADVLSRDTPAEVQPQNSTRVPDFTSTGCTLDEATRIGKLAGLQVRRSAKPGSDYTDVAEAGLIYAQSPAPDEEAKPGSVVYVRVSRGKKPAAAAPPPKSADPVRLLNARDRAPRVDRIWSNGEYEAREVVAQEAGTEDAGEEEPEEADATAPPAAPPDSVPPAGGEPDSGQPLNPIH